MSVGVKSSRKFTVRVAYPAQFVVERIEFGGSEKSFQSFFAITISRNPRSDKVPRNVCHWCALFKNKNMQIEIQKSPIRMFIRLQQASQFSFAGEPVDSVANVMVT